MVVPRGEAAEVLSLAREQFAREESTRDMIAEGKSLEELLAEFGRL